MMSWFGKGVFLLGVIGAMVIAGCAGQTGPAPPPSFNPIEFEVDGYVPKVDNFLVILDASSSMGLPCKGMSKFEQAKAGVGLMNMTLPELDYVGGLRTFGHHPSDSKEKTVLRYGLEKYTTAGFQQGLDSTKRPGGTSPMGSAIQAGASDLDPTQGKIAVVVVSDGVNPALDRPLEDAKNMKRALGERLCIYTVLVGDDPAGAALLKGIADAGECGFYTTMDQLLSEKEMAEFVEKVFLDKAPAPVAAPKPVTPVEEPDEADRQEGPGDADGDGVKDDKDACPNTPMGAHVDKRGCWSYHSILFDFNKSDVKPEFYPMLDNVVQILRENPGLKAEIQGHTDNVGSKQYNEKLSRERASAILTYLVNAGVAADRLTAKGYGFSRPVATNDTEEGRAENRRVQFKPVR